MEFRKLFTCSLSEALALMGIGETCIAPDGCTATSVRKTCAVMKKRGYLFQTSERTGVQTITRLK